MSVHVPESKAPAPQPITDYVAFRVGQSRAGDPVYGSDADEKDSGGER